MLDSQMLVDVYNFSGAPVVYSVPELNVRRQFGKGETKKIEINELRRLSYMPGGKVLLADYLSVANDEFLQEIGIIPEPEYSWTEQEVVEVLTHGSLDQLQDCLDFAPAGIIDFVKDLAVSLKITDMSKREAIYKATGFNVNKAIEANALSEVVEEVKETPKRRVGTTTTTKEDAPQRRVPVEKPKFVIPESAKASNDK